MNGYLLEKKLFPSFVGKRHINHMTHMKKVRIKDMTMQYCSSYNLKV